MFNCKKIISLQLGLCAIAIMLLSGCGRKDMTVPNFIRTSRATSLPAVQEIKTKSKTTKEINEELEKLHHLPPETYYIAPGDKFDLKVYDNEDLNITGLMVTPDGYITIGLVGAIKISGKTIQRAIKDIEKGMAKYIRYPKVILVPTIVSSSTFTIVGKISLPGRYMIRDGTRLTEAVAMAQGFTMGEYYGNTVELADLKHSFISRNGDILPVDFVKAIREGNQRHNIPLRNGDYIFVPSSMNKGITVLGQVNSPGFQGYKENYSLLQSIGFAQGRRPTAADVVVVVRNGLKTPRIFKCDIGMMSEGLAEDFHLAPNDIVYVPRHGFAAYNRVVAMLMPSLQALNLLAGPFGNAALYNNSNDD
jgi:polysaccharide biosynthesis/export protein